MQMGQAVISSVDSRFEQRSELVARSPDIDDRLEQDLCHWSPRRLGLAIGQSESISFYPTQCGKFALSRSVVGAQESSRCGGRRIVSNVVVMEASQLCGYENNVVHLARGLLSTGNLLLQTSGNPKLPMLEIPDRYLLGSSDLSCPEWSGEFEKIVRAVKIHRHVMLIGKPDSLDFLGSFLAALPREQRLQYSFATGLSVQEDRLFNLQFFAESTPLLERQFASLQLRTINLKQERFTFPVPSF